MSDSDENIFLLNDYRNAQKDYTVINARGPSTKNITLDNVNLSLRNSSISRWKPPSNYQAPYSQSLYGSGHDYRMRDTSPISVRSNRYWSEYGQNSRYRDYDGRNGGRCVSPMSVRSIDTNISAVDIVDRLSNCNEDEIRMIKRACKRMELRLRERRFAERRNRQRVQHSRITVRPRGSSGSDSLPSDDNMETRSTYSNFSKQAYKENVPSSSRIYNSSMMVHPKDPARFNPTNYNRMPENILQDKHAMRKEVFHFGREGTQDEFRKPFPPRKEKRTNGSVPNEKLAKASFVSSGRFQNDQSSKSQIRNDMTKEVSSANNQRGQPLTTLNEDDNDEVEIETNKKNEESKATKKRKSTFRNNLAVTKKLKVTSAEMEQNPRTDNNNDAADDFIFAKPQLPSKKVNNVKTQENPQPLPEKDNPKETLTQSESEVLNKNQTIDETQNATNVSSIGDSTMRKRKLFTPSLDITHTPKNMSSDSSSPTKNDDLRRNDSHKSRRLVKSTSCLTRDIQSTNTLMQLLQKELSFQKRNQSTGGCKKNTKQTSNRKDNEEWDVFKVVSSCNDDAKSETFSEEEIFTGTQIKTKSAETKTRDVQPPNNHKINIDVNKKDQNKKQENKEKQHPIKVKNGPAAKYALVDAYWATDIETETDEDLCTKVARNNGLLSISKPIAPNNKMDKDGFKENSKENPKLGLAKKSSVNERNKGKNTASAEQHENNKPFSSRFDDVSKNVTDHKMQKKNDKIITNGRINKTNVNKVTLTNSSVEETTPKGHYCKVAKPHKAVKNANTSLNAETPKLRPRKENKRTDKNAKESNSIDKANNNLKKHETPITRNKSKLNNLYTIKTPALSDTPFKQSKVINNTPITALDNFVANKICRVQVTKTLKETLKLFDTPTLDSSLSGKRSSERIKNRLDRSMPGKCDCHETNIADKCVRRSPRINKNNTVNML